MTSSEPNINLTQPRDVFQESVYRFSKYYLVYARTNGNEPKALDDEFSNVLSSLKYAYQEPGLWSMLIEATFGIHDYMMRQGYWDIWEDALSSVISISEKLNESGQEADLLIKLSGLLIDKGDYEEAEKHLSRTFQLLSTAPSIEREIKAYAKRHMATIMLRRGQLENALKLLDEALDLFTKSEVVAKGNIFLHQSQIHHLMGNNKLAMRSLEKAEKIFSNRKEHHYIGGVFNLYGLIYRSTGEFDRAIDYFIKSLEIFEKTGDRSSYATVHNNLGFTLWTKGEFQRSIKHLHLCLKTAQEIGYKRMVATACGNLGLVQMELGEFVNAFDNLGMQIQICKDIDDKREYCRAVGNLGILHYHVGNYEQALECLDVDRDALLSSGIEASETLAYNSVYRGLTYFELGDENSASNQIQEALRISRKVSSKAVEIIALRGMAKVDTSKAEIYLEQALTLTKEIGKELDIGICKLELGCLIYRIDEKRGGKLLGDAETIFKHLGARSWIEKTVCAQQKNNEQSRCDNF